MKSLLAVCVGLAGAAACGGGGLPLPGGLKDYEVVSHARDSLGVELQRALEARRVPVRRAVKGGGGPAAALLYFEFRDPPPAAGRWLHVRLYDTRSGLILAAATLRTDSLPPTARAQARTAVDSLLAVHPPTEETP